MARWLLALVLWGCRSPADPVFLDPVPDETRDIAIGRVTGPYHLKPGKQVVRLRARCEGNCVKLHLSVDLAFAGAARPPTTLQLVQEGKLLHEHARDRRCFEEEVHREEPSTTCTLVVAHGWEGDALHRLKGTYEVDLILDHAGPPRQTSMSIHFLDVPPK
jgi:hypothetical protein